ncbi:hypothetical protein [Allopontixanthobacter sp.]|uniref:hypothetical protein n=1 Tax=Allopontixanthobacter sp. TaxID=2906452 RepID=UPI002AB9DFBE|nr:hypothetical protein [Allopontixanthobacter sp.]MDZ4306634.1 hypothetical protein [Allopontixanthobacter sp.]
MYSQDEINSAVSAGVLAPEAADKLRAHVVSIRERPVTDEEHFRFVSSFNDIFVSIGVVILLFAVAAIGQAIGTAAFAVDPNDFGGNSRFVRQESAEIMFGAALAAATAWLLAEFFTRKRRMALPSIILLLAFVAGLLFTSLGLAATIAGPDNIGSGSGYLIAAFASGSGLIAAGGAWLHWRRFGVPITIAAGAGALAIFAIMLVVSVLASATSLNGDTLILPLVFLSGMAIFMLAMRWDMSDRERQTRRSDVAFWLHLLAAPMIAHPLFHWLGVTDGQDIGVGAAAGALAVYVAMGLVALAIDRRALLVSALAYVLVTLASLFDRFGAVELNVALTALVIGSALLTLSAFWTPIRRVVVEQLPATMRSRLPAAGVPLTA